MAAPSRGGSTRHNAWRVGKFPIPPNSLYNHADTSLEACDAPRGTFSLFAATLSSACPYSQVALDADCWIGSSMTVGRPLTAELPHRLGWGIAGEANRAANNAAAARKEIGAGKID